MERMMDFINNDEIYKELNFIPYKNQIYKHRYSSLMVSNYGNIIKIIDGKEMKSKLVFDKSKGYMVVNLGLAINNKICHKNILVHRLVAFAFIDNPHNYHIVNHIDCDKTNNYYLNLEWCTTKMNMQHASENGLCNPSKGDSHYISKLNSDIVIDICNMYNDGMKTKEINKMLKTKNIHVSDSTVKQIKSKRTWKEISSIYLN